jgi:hypothetical protein
MKAKTDSNNSGKIRADKLCIAASISLLLGISQLILCFVLNHFVQPYFRSLEDVFALGIWLSIAFLCFVVPFLGLIAIINIITDWRFVTNPDDGPQSKDLIRKIARSFLITSLLFAIVSLLPLILIFLLGPMMNTNLTDLLGIWLIVMALLALAMGFVSYKLFNKTSVRILLRIGAVFSIFLGLIAVVSVYMSTSFGYYLIQRLEYSKITETFSGNSDSLNQTLIVPTLDSPCPKNKNVIWCSSFQLSWNQMKDDVIGEPIQVVGAEELATRLNSAEQSSADLESRSFYSAAGRVKQGIINKIEKDMAAKFPSHSLPDFSYIAAYPEGLLAYSYLIANVPFKYPYRQVRNDFIFTDSNGVKTNVGAFGIWGHDPQYKRIREQAEILYIHEDRNEHNPEHRYKEFAVDLCKHSKPYQVVAAVIEPKGSLAQSLSYIRNQIADFKQTDNHEKMRFLGSVDVLIAPEMFWQIDHRFDELIGKMVSNANPPMPIIEAKQMIKFKLDRYGAILESEAQIAFAGSPICLRFNRPFLVYMKKRDSEQPFFVMWVDNAELLNRK